MISPDILRVMADLHTFTCEDLAAALCWPLGTAGGRLSGWAETGQVVRVKSGKTFVYALSDKSARIAAKLPILDPDEMCLMLVILPTTDRYLYHNGVPVLDTSNDDIQCLIQE